MRLTITDTGMSTLQGRGYEISYDGVGMATGFVKKHLHGHIRVNIIFDDGSEKTRIVAEGPNVAETTIRSIMHQQGFK
jgi:fructose-1-phosphate kinase PfkB-like protein